MKPDLTRLSNDSLEGISLLGLTEVLLKRWRPLVVFPFITSVLGIIAMLLAPQTFTAVASFVPETGSQATRLPGGLTALATQFGLNVPPGANSPRFYADVLESWRIRGAVLDAHFDDPTSSEPGDQALLLDILEFEAETEAERDERGFQWLGAHTAITVNNETSVVTLAVETRYPQLSADIANFILDLLNRFNLETRSSHARERRQFTESRVSNAEDELRAAEGQLLAFLERNHRFESSPELRFEHDRLQRVVAMKQEVLTTLNRSYEEARIEEVNDTPVLTVIDRARPPARRSGPRRRLNVIMAFFFGGLLGVLVASGQEFLERARARDDKDFDKVTTRWAVFKSEIRHPFRN